MKTDQVDHLVVSIGFCISQACVIGISKELLLSIVSITWDKKDEVGIEDFNSMIGLVSKEQLDEVFGKGTTEFFWNMAKMKTP